MPHTRRREKGITTRSRNCSGTHGRFPGRPLIICIEPMMSQGSDVAAHLLLALSPSLTAALRFSRAYMRAPGALYISEKARFARPSPATHSLQHITRQSRPRRRKHQWPMYVPFT